MLIIILFLRPESYFLPIILPFKEDKFQLLLGKNQQHFTIKAMVAVEIHMYLRIMEDLDLNMISKHLLKEYFKIAWETTKKVPLSILLILFKTNQI